MSTAYKLFFFSFLYKIVFDIKGSRLSFLPLKNVARTKLILVAVVLEFFRIFIFLEEYSLKSFTRNA